MRIPTTPWLYSLIVLVGALIGPARAEDSGAVHLSLVATDGWSRNSVNTTSFRYQSVTSRNGWQFVAFYNDAQQVVLARRRLGSDNWEVQVTSFTGTATDAHMGISLGIDANGYLHMSWNAHNTQLRYARSREPYSLNMRTRSMIGSQESSVTYPQFYNLPDGKMLFMYRDGASGNGNLVINRWDPVTRTWTRLHSNLLDGQGQRNAYWQATVDRQGRVHLSWVWRETPDVATNHDMCYAYSDDGGLTWKKSDGTPYTTPITAATAEYAWYIPQNSELINQTSMATDAQGRPYIVTYFNDASTGGIPQIQLIYHDGQQWRKTQVGQRTLDFSLSGGGTKRIPLARPQIVVEQGEQPVVHVIYRDQERNFAVTVATCRDLNAGQWEIRDIYSESVGMWEPTYDFNLWMNQQELHLFLQSVEQLDAEGVAQTAPTPVYILQWTPPVPEPSTIGILGAGTVATLARRTREP